MNAKAAEENEIYDDTRRGCNLFGAMGNDPPLVKKKKQVGARLQIYSTRSEASSVISPSREMTRDDTTNMKVK